MVDEIKRVHLTLAGDQADYVDELAQRYGVTRTQVIRVMVDCVNHPIMNDGACRKAQR